MTVKKEIGLIIYLFGFFLALIPLTNILTILLINVTPADATTEIDVSRSIVLGLVTVCVLPAIIEELIFRGIIQNLLLRFGGVAAITITSILFTILHLSNPVGMPAIFIMSLFMSSAMFLFNKIMFVIILHFVNNLFAYCVYLINYYNDLNTAFTITIVLYLSFAVCSAIVLYTGRKKCPKEIKLLWKRRLNNPTRR